MADDKSDELLSQDDIESALAEAGAANDAEDESAEPAPAEQPEDSGELTQEDIDSALSQTGASPDSRGEAAASGASDVPAEPDARVDSSGRPFDEVAAAMAAAIEADSSSASAPAPEPPPTPEPVPPPAGSKPFDIPQLDDRAGGAAPETHSLDMLRDVKLDVKIELGRTRMLVDDVLKLTDGSVVELDKVAGDPVEVFVNGRLVARGEVLVLNDNFCVRISDIVSRYSAEGDEEAEN